MTKEDILIEQIRELNTNLKALTSEFHNERKEIWKELSGLNVKAGIWGVAGGALAVVPTLVMLFLQMK